MRFFDVILDQAVNHGNFSIFILLAALWQIGEMRYGRRKP